MTNPSYPQLDHPCDIVGDYSQAFLACSYNSEDLLDYLADGRLDELAASMLKTSPEETKWQLGEFYREDGEYAKQLMHYIVLFGGYAFEMAPYLVTPITNKTHPKYASRLNKLAVKMGFIKNGESASRT